MMGGMLVTSIASGQLISRTGHYKIFPVIGTAVMTIGLFLLSRLTPATSEMTASLLMLVLGVGLGMVMQVLVIAVQNAVDYVDLGVATSGATLFRLVGGSLGTAILVQCSPRAKREPRTTGHRERLLMAQRNECAGAAQSATGSASQLRAGIHFSARYDVPAGRDSLWCRLRAHRVSAAASVARDGCRRGRRYRNEAGEAFARPQDEDAVAAHLYAALYRLPIAMFSGAHRAIVARAGETLSPLAAWLLVLVESHPGASPFELARARGIPPERAQAALEELRRRGLVTVPRADSQGYSELTESGCQVLDRLVAARRAHLTELAEEWDPTHENATAEEYLRSAVGDLVPDARRVS